MFRDVLVMQRLNDTDSNCHCSATSRRPSNPELHILYFYLEKRSVKPDARAPKISVYDSGSGNAYERRTFWTLQTPYHWKHFMNPLQHRTTVLPRPGLG